MRTVLLGLAATDVIGAVVLGLLYWHNRGRYKGLGLFLLAFLMHSAGITLMLGRGALPEAIGIFAANISAMGGLLSLYAGLCSFWGRACDLRPPLAMLGLFAALHAYFTFAAPSLHARTINLNVWLAAFFSLCAWVARAGAPPALRPSALFSTLVFVAFAAVSLARVGLGLFVGVTSDFFQSGAADTSLVLVFQLLTVLLVFGLFLMVNRRLLADAQADFEGRVQAERALSGALKVARLGTWNWDIAANRFSASAELLDIFGFKEGEFSGGFSEVMSRVVHPGDIALLEAANRSVAENGAAEGVEYRVLRPGGEQRWVYGVAFDLERDAQGQPRALKGYAQDITERKTAEAAMQSAQKLESLGALAGGIAHDFNNILTGITASLSLLRGKAPAAEAQELVHEAETACRSAKGLAGQLLTFASGGRPVRKPLDLGALARQSAEFSLRGSGVAAEFSIDGEIYALADRDQVFQAVQNLVMNAAQAMGGAGSIQVAAVAVELADGAVPGLPAGKYGALTVRDRGPGIPTQVKGRLFEPYFSTKGTGRGLGLAVCRSIAVKHGGQITMETGPGGTAFTLYLPLTQERPDISNRHAGAAPAAAGKGRVLVMDDEEIIHRALGRMLKELGYEPEIATDGDQALAAWKSAAEAGRPFAAAIMDLTISGGMGGVEAVRRLKELSPSARAIVSSGYADDPVLASYKDYGFSGVLPKPFRLEDLSRALDESAAA